MTMKLTQGIYAFRFNGYEMNDGLQSHIVGIGAMYVDPDAGTFAGVETSTSTRLVSSSAMLRSYRFDLRGTYTDPTDANYPLGQATITFSEIGPVFPQKASPKKKKDLDLPEILEGEFDFVIAGPDRFWLISTKSTLQQGGNIKTPTLVDEVVSGEAILVQPGAYNNGNKERKPRKNTKDR
jgi:hypothetical protein